MDEVEGRGALARGTRGKEEECLRRKERVHLEDESMILILY